MECRSNARAPHVRDRARSEEFLRAACKCHAPTCDANTRQRPSRPRVGRRSGPTSARASVRHGRCPNHVSAMRIAQVAPLHESVPPKLYGGTERVVYYLTEELVRAGHEVTLFASGDSCTSARLRAICPNALRLARCIDPLPHHILMVEKVLQEADDFDVIHFH